MSTGRLSSRHGSFSSHSRPSLNRRASPPPTSLTPENSEKEFEPCAATASFLLYAQRNTVLVLHHDTLAIERRFELHREHVLWVQVDNCSERGQGRLAVSYDAGNTAIVWDILTGAEVARFSSYELMRIACFMRNGNIAFGNDQGNIILFEPSTSEHVSARTIFDPVTALAPSTDCRTFAIGYMNGSILIATLQPSFTIQHTLTTARAPSRIVGLSWHGSSSKQKTEMLATQTSDGDLRVWSVPKVPHAEPPNIIRVLQRGAELSSPGPCWFAWSKNGRIVQHADGETRSWDVRTKKVTFEVIPTIEGVAAITSHGPTATLFTLGRNNTVQQYDITPNNKPVQVCSVQHPPANTPPTPPTALDDRKHPYAESGSTSTGLGPPPYTETDSSADESAAMSPLQKIAREMDSLDALESELRDKVMPLSPSSRASSVSSRSSGRSRHGRKYLYDRPDSSRASSTNYEGTEFSFGKPSPGLRTGHESASIRSVSSYASQSQPQSHARRSNLRKEMLRSPHETEDTASMDLFPYAKARLNEVAFRTPHYGSGLRTAELLQREMLSCVFGWNDDIRSLIRDELSRHRPGSASAVLLAKWLGNGATDSMASMVGSESMTSSDWMLLALSSIGADSQKKVGEAFVQRLLEKGDIHPAVAILLGLSEYHDAIEVYVSQKFWLEAVLLTCLTCPGDWQRTSWLIRKWGETAIQEQQAELAVRCFSCTSIETADTYFSPRAQDAVYTAQQQRLTDPQSAGPLGSPPLSPPSRSGSGRLAAMNASLRLVTTFGDRNAPVQAEMQTTPMNMLGPTPIAQSATLSPGAWTHSAQVRLARDPSSARTATPGGFTRKKRLPSNSGIDRTQQEAADLTSSQPVARDFAAGSLNNSRKAADHMPEPTTAIPEPSTALRATSYDVLLASANDGTSMPSPTPAALDRLQGQPRGRETSRDRAADGLTVQIMETRYTEALSPGPSTGNTGSMRSGYTGRSQAQLRVGALSPPMSANSAKSRAIDAYINSVDEARTAARNERARSRHRGESRRRNESRGPSRGTSRLRDNSESRGGDDVRYIKPAKHSPSSPIPMSPEEIAQASKGVKPEPADTDDENFYKLASPVESHKSLRSTKPGILQTEPTRIDGQVALQSSGRDRGRSAMRTEGSLARSPSSPVPMSPEKQVTGEKDDTQSDGQRFRIRARSSSTTPGDNLQSRRAASRNQRERSTSRYREPRDDDMGGTFPEHESTNDNIEARSERASESSVSAASSARRPRRTSRKELAAKELEQRRLSLARRPSAPSIPLPGETLPTLSSATFQRPVLTPRFHAELGDNSVPTLPPTRSQTVDPDAMSKYNNVKPSMPAIGLPATPRAMRHPRYMGADSSEQDIPAVPGIPGNFSELSSLGGSSTLSHGTSSLLGSQGSSSLLSAETPYIEGSEPDFVPPLLPSTVFGQKGPQAPPRSASAPPEKSHGVLVHPAYKSALPPSSRRTSVGRGHVRKISPPDSASTSTMTSNISSIDEALQGANDHQILILPVEPDEPEPPVLPELQHLAGPMPPPPPPVMFSHHLQNNSGVIDIAIDGTSGADGIIDVPQTLPNLPQPMERVERSATASPAAHRRGPSSVSESIGSRWPRFGERMRSTSRNRTKSPEYNAQPYETKLPPMPTTHLNRESWSQARAKSPYEQAMAAQSQERMIPPPPPAPSEARIYETTIPPSSLPTVRSQSAMGGYRNPKEIRANMPPTTLQQGAFPGHAGFL